MDSTDRVEVQHTTEWALLFPLRTGLLSMKSSFSSLSEAENRLSLNKSDYLSEQHINYLKMPSENSSAQSSTENLYQSAKLRMRRRSSMSDLDKIGCLKSHVPDIVRSATSHSCEHEYESAPNSPHYVRHVHKSVRGSIGDFMNFKRFGGGVGYRTETIIAKTVPLSTVTKRSSSRDIDMVENQLFEEDDCKNSFRGSRSSFCDSRSSLESVESRNARVRKVGVGFSENILLQHSAMTFIGEDAAKSETANGCPARGCGQPLSGSQRTERLSRIIRQQRSTHQLYANISVSRAFIPDPWITFISQEWFGR